jgi:hypothetical protein
MNMQKLFLLLIVYFISTEYSNANHIQFEIQSNRTSHNRSINNLVVIPINSTRCPMYGKTCKIPVYFQSDVKIIFLSSDVRFFKYLKIEACNKTEYKTSTFNMTDYTLKCILIDSIIVGKGYILMKFGNDSLIYDVIITSPERIIDFVQQYFIIVFQTIISIFMGVLLDVETIIKIIKMPKPVLIGFITQYFGMPLVGTYFNDFLLIIIILNL